jgi:hypothetical protein
MDRSGWQCGCLSDVPIIAYGQDLKYPPKPHPEIDGSTVVLIGARASKRGIAGWYVDGLTKRDVRASRPPNDNKLSNLGWQRPIRFDRKMIKRAGDAMRQPGATTPTTHRPGLP